MKKIFVFLIGLVVIISADLMYLTLNKKFYKRILDARSDINMYYALLTWMTIIVSIQTFVIDRPHPTMKTSGMYGMMLGACMYGMYNFTNASIYPNRWTTEIVIGDTLWGIVLMGSISAMLCHLTHKM